MFGLTGRPAVRARKKKTVAYFVIPGFDMFSPLEHGEEQPQLTAYVYPATASEVPHLVVRI